MCTGPHSLLSPQEATGWTPSWIRCWVGASLPKRTKNSHRPFWNHPRNKPYANLLQCLNVHHHWREGMAFTSRLGSSLPFTAFAARVPGPPSDPWPFPLTRPPSLMANFYCFPSPEGPCFHTHLFKNLPLELEAPSSNYLSLFLSLPDLLQCSYLNVKLIYCWPKKN